MKVFICDITPDADCRPATTLLADSAVTRVGVPVFLPDFCRSWRGAVMPAVRISRLGLAIRPEFASRYYDAVTLVHHLSPADATADALDTTFDGALAPGVWFDAAPSNLKEMTCGDLSRPLDGFHELACRAITWISSRITVKNGDIIALSHFSLPVDPRVDSSVSAAIGPDRLLQFKFK